MRSLLLRRAASATSALPLLVLLSCGGGGTSGPDPQAVASVSLSAGSASTEIPKNGTLQLQVSLLNAQGQPVAGKSVTWNSQNSGVAQVSTTGLVTGVGVGSTPITASAEGRTGQITVSVYDPVPPAAPSNLQATAISNTRVNLSWTVGTGITQSFRIERETGGAGLVDGDPPVAGAFAEVATLVTGTTSYADSLLSPTQEYRYRARACNQFGCSDYTEAVSATTFPTLLIETATLPSGSIGSAYTATLQANSGTGTPTWSLAAGALPAGVTLSAAGTLSGTPTAAGTFNFTVRATGAGQTVDRQLSIEVTAVPVAIGNWYLPVVIQGTAYSYGIAASGGDGSNYTYTLTAGGLPPSLSLNTNTGVISGTTTGSAGTFFFTVEVQSATIKATRTFSLTVSSVGVGGFNIAVANVSGSIPNATFQAALNQAIAKWETVITTNFAPFTMPQPPDTLPSNLCQGHGGKLRPGEVIEDFVILLDVLPIDGQFGVVGRAGPCGFVMGNPQMFRAGSFLMDSADIGRLAADQLRATALHEIGHALGIGTMWDILGRDLLTGKGGNDPRFTGAAAIAAYQALGGAQATVAVENTGGTGTQDAHWRKSIFATEVMTGFLEPSGVPMPLSSITIGSLADLGWAVNPAAADPYTLPGAGLMSVEGERERIELLDDIANEPFILLLPGGGQRLVHPPGVRFP